MLAQVAEAGVLHVSFSGGEPFLRGDVFDLIEAAADLGLSTSANTNGSLIPRVRDRLLASPLGTVCVSLDGASAATHDAVRQAPGSFEKALQAVRSIRSTRLGGRPRVLVNVTATAGNCAELADCVRVAVENGADGATLLVAQNQGKFTPDKDIVLSADYAGCLREQVGRLKQEFGGFIPHPAEYLDNFATYIEHPKTLYRYRCVAGFSTALIMPNGDVCACPTGDFRLGNVRHSSFAEIWSSSSAEAARGAIREGRHPICWCDCVAPITILASYLRPRGVHRLLNPVVLKHIAWKLRA